jgi:hypothetical protein
MGLSDSTFYNLIFNPALTTGSTGLIYSEASANLLMKNITFQTITLNDNTRIFTLPSNSNLTILTIVYNAMNFITGNLGKTDNSTTFINATNSYVYMESGSGNPNLQSTNSLTPYFIYSTNSTIIFNKTSFSLSTVKASQVMPTYFIYASNSIVTFAGCSIS